MKRRNNQRIVLERDPTDPATPLQPEMRRNTEAMISYLRSSPSIDERMIRTERVARYAERFNEPLLRALTEDPDLPPDELVVGNFNLDSTGLELYLRILLSLASQKLLSPLVIRNVLQVAFRRGDLKLSGRVVEEMRTVVLRHISEHPDSPSPPRLLGWLDAIQASWRSGEVAGEEFHRHMLSHYLREDQNSFSDPAGRVLALSPSLSASRLMRLFDDYDSGALADSLAQEVIISDRADLMSRRGVRRRLWKHENITQVQIALLLFPDARDFPRLVEEMLDGKDRTIQRAVLLSDKIDGSVISWLPDNLLLRLLQHEVAEIRMKMIRSLPSRRHPRPISKPRKKK